MRWKTKTKTTVVLVLDFCIAFLLKKMYIKKQTKKRHHFKL